MVQKINKIIIGSGSPRVAIVGCLHGDEIIGKKVIHEIKKIKKIKGTLGLFIANEPALKKKKREIKQDLNRSFPGKKGGRFEIGLAYRLHQELRHYDIVLDIHATNSHFDALGVVTKLDARVKKVLSLLSIEKILLARRTVFGGHEMITHVPIGVAIEYGPNKSGKNYRRALSETKLLLCNLGMISGKKRKFYSKDIYDASGVYKVPEGFIQDKKLQDFHLIKKGQQIGTIKRQPVLSRSNFYPLFLGKGAYNGTLSIIAKKRKIRLK